MQVYLDTCCYGRPWDDQNDPQIAADTIAIMTILESLRLAGRRVVASTAVAFELSNIPPAHLHRADIINFYDDSIDVFFTLTPADYARAKKIETDGVGELDSQHLAAAEAVGATYLLTTDADFWKRAQKKNLTAVKVLDPLTFLVGGVL